MTNTHVTIRFYSRIPLDKESLPREGYPYLRPLSEGWGIYMAINRKPKRVASCPTLEMAVRIIKLMRAEIDGSKTDS